MIPPKCNRAFAEVLAASVERSERKEFERDWGEMRLREQPLRQPRLHQSNFDSAFIVAILLAIVALLLCSVR